MKKAIYMEEHQCIKCPYFICIEKYSINGIGKWYFNISGKLNAIKYCPYCGKDLYEEEDCKTIKLSYRLIGEKVRKI